ncbi:MAG: GrpB family protein [Nocardioidaceae bacterium]
MSGGQHAPAEVVEYDPGWPGQFARIRDRVTPALGPVEHRVEHVGSTAVPGLAAKPIIDVDVVVAEPDVDRTVALLATLGYRHLGDLGVAAREALLPPTDEHYHHLYVVADGSAALADHVDLRDYLLAHPAAAQRYARRKYELAHLLETDRDEYVRQKGDLVEELLHLARSGRSGEVEP